MSAMGGSSAPADLGLLQPSFTFPAEGQYKVFVDFWLSDGDRVQVSAPFTIGSASVPAVKLEPDQSLTQSLDDVMQVTLKSDKPLIARQDLVLSFEFKDSAGTVRTNDIQVISRNLLKLEMIDESLSAYLQPELVNRQQIGFAVNFPKAGIYKLWLTFLYPGIEQKMAFVVSVK